MTKTKTMVVNGTTFEVQKDSTRKDSTYGVDRNEIFQRYGRPSNAKIGIWQDWCKWAEECGANIAISGAGCNFFSITGNVEIDGEDYNLWITYAHNRISKVA